MHTTLTAAVERRRRSGDRASLLMLDIDRFKDINDALGHAEGDRVLKCLVALVGQRMRKVDALFRAGGEEFILLLSGTRFTDAVSVAEDSAASCRILDSCPGARCRSASASWSWGTSSRLRSGSRKRTRPCIAQNAQGATELPDDTGSHPGSSTSRSRTPCASPRGFPDRSSASNLTSDWPFTAAERPRAVEPYMSVGALRKRATCLGIDRMTTRIHRDIWLFKVFTLTILMACLAVPLGAASSVADGTATPCFPPPA
jgi:hypothetical protein